MNDKYTVLFSRAEAEVSTVPPNTCAVTFGTADHRAMELRTGAVIPPATPLLNVYAVPTLPVETRFAVFGAIDCLKPDGGSFQPGFCFSFSLRYISAAGLQKLILTYRKKMGHLPDCLTLEDLQQLLAADLKRICTEAARAFSGGQPLSYTHWWQDFKQGGRFCETLRMPLMQLFSAYGFRMELDSLSMAGLAPIPA